MGSGARAAMVGVRGDIGGMMPGDAARGGDSTPTETLSREEFARRFSEASVRLRCVALAIVGDHARAEDLVQESAAIALGKLDEFRLGTSFGAWMAQIVRFAALNERRKGVRRGVRLADPGVLDVGREAAEGPGSPPVDSRGRLVEFQASFDDEVVGALWELDEAARACLLLRTTLGLTYREIAEVLGIAEGTAMSHVHRSRRRMRETLLRYEQFAARERRSGHA